MSKQQKIPDGTAPDTLSDILLVMNMEKKSMRVASDEAGKTDRFDKLTNEDNPPFLKITGSSMVENFVMNYFSQSKNPTHFRLFRVPLLTAKEAAPNMRELFKPNPSPEMQDFFNKYEVKPVFHIGDIPEQSETPKQTELPPLTKMYELTEFPELSEIKKQTQQRANEAEIAANMPPNPVPVKSLSETEETSEGSQTQSKNFNQNNSSSNKLNIKEMATNQNQTTTAPAETASQPRINEAMINWEQLKNFGISRDYLKEKGLLENMLKGYKTNQLVPIRCNFGSVAFKGDARLSFQQTPNGVVLAMHGMSKEPKLNTPYYGHVFTEEDKKNLRETGNMGRQAWMSFPNEPEKVPYLISIDKLTNEICGVRADRVFIPDEVCGVKLTDNYKQLLREGKAIEMEDMLSKKGNLFNSKLQICADKRGIDFKFDNDGQFNRNEIGGVKLTEKQKEDLIAGKYILLEDMEKRTTKEKFSSFVKLDGNKVTYSRINHDTGEIYVPKEISGTRLTHEDREELRAGRVVFLKDMVNNKGEEFSSFVKLNEKTGYPQYSKTPDGFNERPAFVIPPEVYGVSLKATERAALQDGKAIYLENLTGHNGQNFSSWAKVNVNRGMLEYFSYNPDQPRQTANTETRQQPDKEAEKQEKRTNKRSVA